MNFEDLSFILIFPVIIAIACAFVSYFIRYQRSDEKAYELFPLGDESFYRNLFINIEFALGMSYLQFFSKNNSLGIYYIYTLLTLAFIIFVTSLSLSPTQSEPSKRKWLIIATHGLVVVLIVYFAFEIGDWVSKTSVS